MSKKQKSPLAQPRTLEEAIHKSAIEYAIKREAFKKNLEKLASEDATKQRQKTLTTEQKFRHALNVIVKGLMKQCEERNIPCSEELLRQWITEERLKRIRQREGDSPILIK